MLEQETESFIVKVWVEEQAREANDATWRGHVTHVPSGERWYVERLGQIPAIIRPYLERLGVKFSRLERWRLRLRRRS
ncbi:MAG: hypothetical protein PVF47_04720 [Anaerolineae bacterium]|jgi:hypothetical protein